MKGTAPPLRNCGDSALLYRLLGSWLRPQLMEAKSAALLQDSALMIVN